MELFSNGAGIMRADETGYYILDKEWECYIKVSRQAFINELRNISWVCLTTWNKELRQEYLDMIDYVKEMK